MNTIHADSFLLDIRTRMNCSKNPDFVLSGLLSDPDKRQFLFGLFMALYLLGLLGNLLLLLTIGADIRPHTPMYFFLIWLSGWSLLYNHHSPQNAGGFLDKEWIDHFLWMSGKNIFLCGSCGYRQPAFDCHGYWLLCCHLPSSALSTPNDSRRMWTAGGWVHALWLPYHSILNKKFPGFPLWIIGNKTD